jgi:hypothetical protein
VADRRGDTGPRPTLIAGIAAAVLTWAGSASAGPAAIAASRVEAFSAPSRQSSVVSELGQGAPVCVLDQTNYPGVLLHRQGWLAIRLPGGVGYVPVETIDLAAPAPEVPDCSGSSIAPGTQAVTQAQPQTQSAAPVLPPGSEPIAAFSRRQAADPSEPPAAVAPAVVDRTALLPGRFLPIRQARALFGLGTGLAHLDPQTAASNQIGDSGITLNGTFGLTVFDIVMLSATFSVPFVSDKAPFSQDVVLQNGGGDSHSADSNLHVVTGSVAIGLRTPFWAIAPTDHGWATGAVFAQYGIAGIDGGRSISDCVDCRDDHLQFPGGTFWRVGVDLSLPGAKPDRYYGLTVTYESYMAGAGLTDEVRVGFSYWL